MICYLILCMQDLGPRVCSDPASDWCLDLSRGLKRTTFDPQWYRPSSLAELVAIARGNKEKRVRLVAGDTGKGLSYRYTCSKKILSICVGLQSSCV